MQTIRVFLVDDHPLIRKGIRAALAEAGIQVSGEAGSCWEAEKQLQAALPDVLLLDLQLPDGCGLDFAQQIRERAPALPILILSAHNQENFINGALQVGARGFVLKDEAPDVLPRAIRGVMRGEVWLSGAVAQKMATRTFRDRGHPDYGLTPRELDVLRRMVQGKNDTEIAAELRVTTRSLRTYLRNIYDKLGVHSRVQAVSKALVEEITYTHGLKTSFTHPT